MVTNMVIKWVARKTYKIYFNQEKTAEDVKTLVNEIGYHVLDIEYFRGKPIVLATKVK